MSADVLQSSTPHLLLLLLLAFIHPTFTLHCMVCRTRTFMGLDSNDMDRFRVTTNMPHPKCRHLERVVCDRDQDVCVRISMEMGLDSGGYWIGMGCDYSANYAHIGCEDLKEQTRTVSLDRGIDGKPVVEERRSLQNVCVCRFDLCNGATKIDNRSLIIIMLIICCSF